MRKRKTAPHQPRNKKSSSRGKERVSNKDRVLFGYCPVFLFIKMIVEDAFS